MMTFEGQELKEHFEDAFGRGTETITVSQMWWLLKFAKHVRGRCRSNKALENYFNRNFDHLRFSQRQEEDDEYPRTVIEEKM